MWRLIVNNSNNASNPFYLGPQSWNNIRTIGTENYFDTIQNKFFEMSSLSEEGCIRIINKCFGGSKDSEIFNYLVFDNRPFIKRNPLLLFADHCKNIGIHANGIYVSADKVSLCKKLGITIAVDDDPRVALALASANIKTILMIRKWNFGFDRTNLYLSVPENKMDAIHRNLILADCWKDIEENIFDGD